MRTSSLARVVMASLGVSVVVTLGCVPPPPPTTPSGTPTQFSVQSIFPAEGLSAGATVAMIAGTGFQPGDTVTVDGSRVDATVLSANTISITMPAHAAGNVDVTVISAISQARESVPGGYSYVPPEPSAAQRDAALALFGAASLHEMVTTSALTSATEYGKVLFNGPCVSGIGSLQGALDGGASPTPGTFLPTGSHTYVVSFSKCQVGSGFGYLELDGVASAAYSAAGWSILTATVSAESARARVDEGDLTADGSAVWTRSSAACPAACNESTTYTPAPGSRLVNNSTSNVAIFGGGSYSVIRSFSPWSMTRRFDNLQVAVSGTEYTLNGSLVWTNTSMTGEIRINHNGMLVARIYGDRNNMRVEVLVPLVPL